MISGTLKRGLFYCEGGGGRGADGGGGGGRRGGREEGGFQVSQTLKAVNR